MPRLVHRLDAGAAIGLGHLARALAISDAMSRAPDWRVTWATRTPDTVRPEASADILVAAADESEEQFLERASGAADVLVIDHRYHYSTSALARARANCRVIMLDATIGNTSDVDALVLPTAHADPGVLRSLSFLGERLHYGPEWVLMHPRVTHFSRAAARRADAGTRVLVTGGGGDPRRVTQEALTLLDAISAAFTVDVLLGSANPMARELRARAASAAHPTVVHDDPDTFPRVTANATLAIAAFGVTAYELAHLGVPGVLCGHDEESSASAARFAQLGCAVSVGSIADLRSARAHTTVQRLLVDTDSLARMSRRGTALVDGKGAERFASLVTSLFSRTVNAN